MAAPAAGFEALQPPLAVADHARFFKSWLRRIAPDAPKEITLGDTHQDQASGDEAPCRPGGLCRPRRTLVPQRVQWVHHRPVLAGFPAPIPCWLALRAIRFYCRTVTAARHPIQTKWLSLQSPNPGLPVAVVTHAKQRVTSNGLRSFRMWKQARARYLLPFLVFLSPFFLPLLLRTLSTQRA